MLFNIYVEVRATDFLERYESKDQEGLQDSWSEKWKMRIATS